MNLILWRHADAEDHIDDAARKLTAKGLQQTAQMAQWLKPLLPHDVRVLVSPALRAQQTAKALHLPMETTKEIAVNAIARDVLTYVNWPQSKKNFLIVGHQPTLGQIAALLIDDHDGDVDIKKASVWWFEARHRSGKFETVLRVMMTPEMLQAE